MSIALFDLRSQYRDLQNEIDRAVIEVLEGGDYILGSRVQKLENQVTGYCGVKFGIGVASGTDALFLALLACGVGPGDEVITTPFTFIATSAAISRTGATPVFVDIDSRTYNIDPEKVEAGITARTKAVIPVHIFGQMADMDEILHLSRENDLAVIEDACQAMGSQYMGKMAGALGIAGCFSFFPTKILGCCGDGGMVVTGSEKVAARIRSLRSQGSSKKFIHDTVGFNSRLDEIQAAILLVKFKYIEDWLNRRAELAGLYSRLLEGAVVTPCVKPGIRHTYHLYVVRTTKRESIIRNLEKNGVSYGLYYPLPLHLQAAYKDLGYRKGDLPVAEKASEELLAIPIYPELTRQDAERIAFLVRQGASIG